MLRMSLVPGLALLLLPLQPAAAVQASPAPPPIVKEVLTCRSIGDAAERLSCFDRAVAALEQAQSSGELVAMDRQQVRQTRRSLFGLTLPNLGVLGDGNDRESSEVETTINRARQGPDGKWIFDLAEGGRWAQIDSQEFVIDPAAGQGIRIRRAALGSYLANVNKQRAVRVRRVN